MKDVRPVTVGNVSGDWSGTVRDLSDPRVVSAEQQRQRHRDVVTVRDAAHRYAQSGGVQSYRRERNFVRGSRSQAAARGSGLTTSLPRGR